MELALRIIGVSHIVLALAHVPMAYHLRWRSDAARMAPVNRQVFWSHTFFVCLILVFMGMLAAGAPQTLLTPTLLGRWVTTGLTVFWAARLICQWFFFEWSHWRGKTLETAVHCLFTAAWVTYVVVYASALRFQWRATPALF